MFKKIKEFLFENKTARQTIAKNSFWLTVSNFGGRAIKAIVIIYAARVLGAADYGVFSYALTLAAFLSLFMDPGINTVLMRDASKATGEQERYEIFSTAFGIKLILIALGVVIVVFGAPHFTTLPGAQILLPIVACIMMFDTLREFFLSLFRGMEKMQWEAGIFIFTNFAIVIFGFIFIMRNPTPASLGWGYAIGTILGAIAAMVTLRSYIKNLFSHFSPRLIIPMMQSAWPFAIVGVLGLLLTNTDILVISWLRPAADVGIYAAAIRIIQVLYLVPTVLQVSTLPLFARLAKHEDAKFRIVLERMLGVMFLISIPLAVGGVILGTQIMTFIFGNTFAPGGVAFKLLIIGLVVDYTSGIIANALFTYGHQKSLIVSSVIGGVSNIILDLLLIPHWGMTGSAIATLIAQILSNSYLWGVMNKVNPFSIIPQLKKLVLASIVMLAAIVTLSLLHINLIVIIATSGLLYFLMLKILREPLLEETFKILPSR